MSSIPIWHLSARCVYTVFTILTRTPGSALCLIKPMYSNSALCLLQASQTPGNELPGGQYLSLQQPDVCQRTLGSAHPAWIQAAGDGQSQQATVCAVELQQSVSTDWTWIHTHTHTHTCGSLGLVIVTFLTCDGIRCFTLWRYCW